MARIDPSETAVIVAESLEADRLWNRLAGRDLLSGPQQFEEKGDKWRTYPFCLPLISRRESRDRSEGRAGSKAYGSGTRV